MLELNETNLPGIRKVANYALVQALIGAMFTIRKEQSAADEPTIDQFNELHEELTTPQMAPVGLDNERSSFGRWAGIYFALRAELAKTNNKYVSPMNPADMWHFLSTMAEHPRVSEDKIKELAEALELPAELVKTGMHAAAVAEDNKRIAMTDAVLGHVNGFENAGTVEDLYALTNKEKEVVLAKYVEGLDREINRLVSTGLAFRLKDGLSSLRLMRADIKAAEVEIKKLAA